MRLATLRQRISTTTAGHRHRIEWSAPGPEGRDGFLTQHGECRFCKAVIVLREDPPPGEPDISGEALTRRCLEESIVRRSHPWVVSNLVTLRRLERAGIVREVVPGDWQAGRTYVAPVGEQTRFRGKYEVTCFDGCPFHFVTEIRPISQKQPAGPPAPSGNMRCCNTGQTAAFGKVRYVSSHGVSGIGNEAAYQAFRAQFL